MSGIAGIIRFDGAPVTADLISDMTAAMAHRGPDGIGHRLLGSAALGHCMLCTTPESLTESQPLVSEDESLVLVMDGRIDNRDELHHELLAAGARLRDCSDAGLVLAAYECWGRNCLRRFEGDFALVIWDAARRAAFCARDQLGARPFFYYWDGRRLVFASELHPILAVPWVPEELNEGMVAEILANDMLSRDETLWRDVRRLVAAHHMLVRGERVEIKQYWTPDLASEIRYGSDREYTEHYRALLEEAVRRHSRSHLPIAFEVSGGLDSSAVFAVGDHLLRTGRLLAPGIEGETLCFEGDPDADEIAYARTVGRHLGRTINETAPYLAPLDWYEDWTRRYRDFPHFPNTVMSLGLYEGVVRKGKRAILTGYGGDEWQMGTRYYYADFLHDLELGELVRAFARDCHHCGIGRASYWLARCGLFPYLPGAVQDMFHELSTRLRGRPPDLASWLGTDLKAMLDERKSRHRARCAALAKKRHAQSLTTLESATRAHNRESFEMLASSAGIERRDPLTSLPLVQFHFSTPERTRLRGRAYRFTHRAAMRGLVPDRVLDRSDKAHFSETIRRHLPAFEDQGPFPLSASAPEWIDGAELARRLTLARTNRNVHWPLWSIWQLFGCELVGKDRMLSKLEDSRRG